MLCTFCGTENRPENKFCGMCGVRMDRRQVERRGLQSIAALKCPSCGHVNEAGHKFCGMCGARTDRRTITDRRPAPANGPRAAAIANAQLPGPETAVNQAQVSPARVAPATAVAAAPASPAAPAAPAVDEPISHPKASAAIFKEEPATVVPPPVPRVSGPSFLGLGDDPNADASYLLEDERNSRGILRKLVLIAILAAIAGLVFAGWRSGTFKAFPKFPKATPNEPTAQPSPRSANQGAPADASPTPDAASTDSASSGSTAPASTVASPAPDANDAPKETTVAAKPSSEVEERSVNDGANAKNAAPAAKAQASDPATVAKKPSAALLKAQQYLQGRGVPQSCEQGMVYLRAATEQNDPAAAVQMGALYASGHCVSQDRVMAYRWFNSAHELDPSNQWIQKDMAQLWANMTPQERQKAGP